MVTPRNEAERAVFELWKEFRPDEAFVLGLDECAGRLFIPTQRRVDGLLAKIARIQKSAKSPIERKLLASFRASLELREPARLPQTLLESLFGYMIKEGVKANHVRALAADGRKALDANRKRARGPTAPGMRALVQLACNGLNEILKGGERAPRQRCAGGDPVARRRERAIRQGIRPARIRPRGNVRRDLCAVQTNGMRTRPIPLVRARPPRFLGLHADAGSGGGRRAPHDPPGAAAFQGLGRANVQRTPL